MVSQPTPRPTPTPTHPPACPPASLPVRRRTGAQAHRHTGTGAQEQGADAQTLRRANAFGRRAGGHAGTRVRTHMHTCACAALKFSMVFLALACCCLFLLYDWQSESDQVILQWTPFPPCLSVPFPSLVLPLPCWIFLFGSCRLPALLQDLTLGRWLLFLSYGVTVWISCLSCPAVTSFGWPPTKFFIRLEMMIAFWLISLGWVETGKNKKSSGFGRLSPWRNGEGEGCILPYPSISMVKGSLRTTFSLT